MKIYKLTISQEIQTDAIAVVGSYVSPRNETTEYYSTRELADQRQKEIEACVKTLNMSGMYPLIMIAEITVIESFNKNGSDE